MSTKARSRFLNRIAHYDADVEVIDVLATAVGSGLLKSETMLFDGLDPARHVRLVNRVASDHGRSIAINHLYNSMMASFIKDLYEDFSSYLAEIVKACAKKGLLPGRLIGKHGFTIEANDLLALGSWDAVVGYISATLFRKLEDERSTINLLKAIDSKLDLKLDAKIRDAAMPYLDLRHILVHRDGVADHLFAKSYPQFQVKDKEKVHMSFARTKDARVSIVALVDHIDSRVISNGLISASDIHKAKASTP